MIKDRNSKMSEIDNLSKSTTEMLNDVIKTKNQEIKLLKDS